MTNKILVMTALLCACGGIVDEQTDDEDTGQTEQAFTAAVSDTFQLGTQTGPAQLRCDRATTGQVCNVTDHKNRVYCTNSSQFADGLGTAQSAAYLAIEDLDTALTNWSFDVGDYELFQDKCISPGPITGRVEDIHLIKGAVGSVGSASNDIKDYVTVQWSGFTGLTEGAGVKGQYQSAFGCNVKIDVVDITAKSNGGQQPAFDRLVKHATQHGVLACLGMGGRTVATGNTGTATRAVVNQAQTFSALSNAEKCVLNGYTATANGLFNNALIPCTGD